MAPSTSDTKSTEGDPPYPHWIKYFFSAILYWLIHGLFPWSSSGIATWIYVTYVWQKLVPQGVVAACREEAYALRDQIRSYKDGLPKGCPALEGDLYAIETDWFDCERKIEPYNEHSRDWFWYSEARKKLLESGENPLGERSWWFVEVFEIYRKSWKIRGKLSTINNQLAKLADGIYKARVDRGWADSRTGHSSAMQDDEALHNQDEEVPNNQDNEAEAPHTYGGSHDTAASNHSIPGSN